MRNLISFCSRWIGKPVFAVVLTCVAVPCAIAAPITYTFSGLVSGSLGATPFSNAQITITATGDTSSVPNLTLCTPGGGQPICNNLSSVAFTITGVGSGTITDALFIFDQPSVPALGLERVVGGDWVDIDGAQFATYQLKTSIGPFTATTHLGSPFGSVATTAGVLALTSNPDVFQAVTAAAPSPPTIVKGFGASSVPVSGSTSLTFTITNPNISTALTGVGFTDTLPAGLVVSTPNGLTGSCGGGTITATAGSGSVSLASATLAGSASCTFSANVTGTTAGTKNNTTGAIASAEGGSGGTASASVTVNAAIAPPTVAKAFGAASIVLNGSTTLTFTITNPNASTSLGGINLTDSLPSGLVVSTPNGLVDGCGGVTAVAGSGTVSLVDIGLAANSSCTYSVNITGTTLGTKNNTTDAVTSDQGAGGSASASLVVTSAGPPPPLLPITPVPTLQEWALWLLGLLILGTASVTFRRRRD